MKIAIHHRKGSFSDFWKAYCIKNNIDYKIVNAYSNNIIQEMEDCDGLIWNHHQSNYKDKLIAPKVLYSLEQSGKYVFPNFNTGWHFDDKVAQKYLLESIKAPLIPSFVFYNKEEAKSWCKQTSYPIVWKLSGGSSGDHVKLIENEKQAFRFVDKAFSRGFAQYDKIGSFKERIKRYRNNQGTFYNVLKGFLRLFWAPKFSRHHNRERNYIYFQKFIPNNKFDNRIIIIGDRAFGVSRFVRKGDFRSSDHHGFSVKIKDIDKRCVKIAFEITKQLKTQSMGFDFIFDEENNPVIAEMGYAFIRSTYADCPGYWNKHLQFHPGSFNPVEWMIEDLIKQIKES